LPLHWIWKYKGFQVQKHKNWAISNIEAGHIHIQIYCLNSGGKSITLFKQGKDYRTLQAHLENISWGCYFQGCVKLSVQVKHINNFKQATNKIQSIRIAHIFCTLNLIHSVRSKWFPSSDFKSELNQGDYYTQNTHKILRQYIFVTSRLKQNNVKKVFYSL
jgi:hypothetical protein